MTTTTNTWKSKLCALLLVPSIGLIVWALLGKFSPEVTVLLGKHAEHITNAVSTLCIALVSIMAGFVALATSLKDSFWVRRFRSSGQMEGYLFLYIWTIVLFVVVHILSVFSLMHYDLYRVVLALLIATLGQFILVIVQASKIASNSDG